MRDRQYLGVLRVRDGVIALERMYFADEIRPTDEVEPEDVEVDDRELEMARELIDRFSGTFPLDELGKDELLERAKKAGISGRTKMSKRELVDALERA